MPGHISGPRTDLDGLEELEPLWVELHRHHRDISQYQGLVADLAVSWRRRRDWYRRLLRDGGCYLTAHDDRDAVLGYAMVAIEDGPDDTFAGEGGIAEVVTLVVAGEHRSAGVGDALLRASEGVARDRGVELIKIAVMAGNRRAQDFYEGRGYRIGEHVLYRRLEGPESGR